MAAKKKPDLKTGDLYDIAGKLKTAPCVPSLREAVKVWRAGGYKGTTDTTRRLLKFWFRTDHRLPNGERFHYHRAQAEAIETLIFVWEAQKVRGRRDLLERFAESVDGMAMPPNDGFARYCLKMATGSGKTKVMALAIAWQFMNAAREKDAIAKEYAKTFLLIAPNVIVLERLKTDFAAGRIFKADPIIPKDLQVFWDFDCVIRGEGEKAHAEGTLYLTNIQQLYEKKEKETSEPGPMAAVLGAKPPTKKLDVTAFKDRIALRDGNLMVLNDEAHHTHDEDSSWNEVIDALHVKTPLNVQLDVSATPRTASGVLFPWTIFDYPLKQAILDEIVKRPVRGVAQIQETQSEHASVRYQGFLVAAVERWKEYTQQLKPLGKRPVLFIMLHESKEADDVGAWLRERYPRLLGEKKTLVIHTRKNGEISDDDLEEARTVARDVDAEHSEVGAIVSVLMLREGWDVQNVTVVVGLRPMTAKANILPEQAVGRGLRLMFRGMAGYKERVDILGSPGFMQFVDDLEKLEGMELEKFNVGKDKLSIETILPLDEKKAYDIGLPQLAAVLVRKKSLADEIGELDVAALKFPALKIDAPDELEKLFTYEGFDVITNAKELERQYQVPTPQTAQEVIGYYARRIAERVKLPSQFAAIALKLREFFESRAFGKKVDLGDKKVIRAMATPLAHYISVRTFELALKKVAIEERSPEKLAPDRMLSLCKPFPWSRQIVSAKKTVFNKVAAENELEGAFARFLEGATDVKAFAKLPQAFGFAIEYLDAEHNLRLYFPDFVAVDTEGRHFLIETKGAETSEVRFKDAAAKLWCENASALSGVSWTFKKVSEKAFKALGPTSFEQLEALDVPAQSTLD